MPVSDISQPGQSPQTCLKPDFPFLPSHRPGLLPAPGALTYLQRRGGWCPRCGRLPPRCWQWPQCLWEAVSPGYASADKTSLSLGRGQSQDHLSSLLPHHHSLPPPSLCPLQPALPVKKTLWPFRTALSTAACSSESCSWVGGKLSRFTGRGHLGPSWGDGTVSEPPASLGIAAATPSWPRRDVRPGSPCVSAGFLPWSPWAASVHPEILPVKLESRSVLEEGTKPGSPLTPGSMKTPLCVSGPSPGFPTSSGPLTHPSFSLLFLPQTSLILKHPVKSLPSQGPFWPLLTSLVSNPSGLQVICPSSETVKTTRLCLYPHLFGPVGCLSTAAHFLSPKACLPQGSTFLSFLLTSPFQAFLLCFLF